MTTHQVDCEFKNALVNSALQKQVVCDNFVIQDKEVAVEETDKQDKQSEEKKVCAWVSACMITTKQEQRSM